jgi:hypothetical protein
MSAYGVKRTSRQALAKDQTLNCRQADCLGLLTPRFVLSECCIFDLPTVALDVTAFV